MNNVRVSVNKTIRTIVAALGQGFTFWTGDEQDPTIVPPAVGLRWIDGERPGPRSESRTRLAQLEVLVGNSDSFLGEAACEALLEGLNIRRGTKPIGVLPLMNWNSGAASPTRFVIEVRPTPEGWVAVPPPNQQTRLYVYTIEVSYDLV